MLVERCVFWNVEHGRLLAMWLSRCPVDTDFLKKKYW